MKTLTLKIPASSMTPFYMVGDFIRVIESTYPIHITTDNSLDVLLDKGQAIGTPTPFNSIEITNKGAADNTVILYIGAGEFHDDRLIGTVATSSIASDTLATIADNAVTVAEIVAPLNATRKAVVIAAAPGNTANVRVGDVNIGAARGITLQPGQSITIETTAAVYAYCATAQTVEVMEV